VNGSPPGKLAAVPVTPDGGGVRTCLPAAFAFAGLAAAALRFVTEGGVPAPVVEVEGDDALPFPAWTVPDDPDAAFPPPSWTVPVEPEASLPDPPVEGDDMTPAPAA
jgi:hypothetical protein